MNLLVWGSYLLAAYLWADWRSWRQYYPTYLFVVATNLLSSIITFNHTLWNFPPTYLLANHTITEFYIMLVTYPAMVLLYLSRYPAKGLWQQVRWVLLWIAVFTLSELFLYHIEAIIYKNNWSLGWSVFHNIIMFPTLRLHFISPLLAWFVSALYFILIWNYFGFSIQGLK